MLFDKNNTLYSPVTGESYSLEALGDGVFSSKQLGEGLVFTSPDDVIFAPCYGEVVMVAKTRHAIGIKMKNDAEVLIHVGLDTVDLKGKGFEVFVKKGQKITTKDPIIKIDREFMKKNNIDLPIIVVVTNSQEYHFSVELKKNVVRKEKMFKIIKGK